MEFSERRFITSDIKYDFNCNENGQQFREDWVKCRINVKSTDFRFIEIDCYPIDYKANVPWEIKIDFSNVRCERALFGSKENMLALIWWYRNEKCQFLMAINDTSTFDKYFIYLKDLLKIGKIAKEEREAIEEADENFRIISDESPNQQMHSFNCIKEIAKKTRHKFKPLTKILANVKRKIASCKEMAYNKLKLNGYTVEEFLKLK